MFYYDYRWYTPQRPIKVKGGIKAQSKSGSFGKSWWARRWITVLESFRIGARLGRGRSYARGGQVMDISIERGFVTAKVQGSRPSPYKVAIALKPLSDKEWDKVIKLMANRAIYSAKLLAGEMPQDIEEVFNSAKVAMFPGRLNDMKTECSCPDFSNPCKHIAAVYYIIGEEFDHDPFLIFHLRGMPREKLMESIRQHRGSGSTPTGPVENKDVSHIQIKIEDVPVKETLETFWQMGDMPEVDTMRDISVPPVHAALLKGLGTPPLWRGHEHFMDAMKSLYPCFTKISLKILMNEQQNTAERAKM